MNSEMQGGRGKHAANFLIYRDVYILEMVNYFIRTCTQMFYDRLMFFCNGILIPWRPNVDVGAVSKHIGSHMSLQHADFIQKNEYLRR